jgi:hypothetical protein
MRLGRKFSNLIKEAISITVKKAKTITLAFLTVYLIAGTIVPWLFSSVCKGKYVAVFLIRLLIL